MRRPAMPDAEALLLEELGGVRPGLVTPYVDALPGARAAVLTRLWRALAHEPLPWVTRRARRGDGLVLRLADGRRVYGPRPDPYATDAYVTGLVVEGTAYDRPDLLMTELQVGHGDGRGDGRGEGRGGGFAAELGGSVASLALSRAGQPDDGASPATSAGWEQRVVDGHPYHPNCRSRPGFSVAEQLAYGPEHRPVVRLGLVAAGDCLVRGAWPRWLRDDEGRVLIPVHPWQVEHVLTTGAHDLTVLPGPGARPLMSLRTLALPGGPGSPHGLHVKTALSARLTSSVRDISVYSVETSATVSAFAEDVTGRLDGLLHVTRTLGAATAGSPDLAAVLRESPETYAGAGERVVPVAALPATGLTRSPSWLADFARLALSVGLRLLDMGVALEAHGQNLLVVLSATGSPVRLVYRDLADIRLSPVRLARHGLAVPALSGRLVTDDPDTLRRKLFGSLVAGALSAAAGSGPALRSALAAAVPDLPPTADLPHLLHDPLPAKALTLMRLSPERPGDLWTGLPNPLADDSF
ncbi:IucA/IucC family protein [Streptomyces sp. NPDC008313]|uniref:IucA/IucC family protein n=1 Tax=Streptomyces sp. NPDC008313 TaxID=3364826 RepID=UPI0036EA8421